MVNKRSMDLSSSKEPKRIKTIEVKDKFQTPSKKHLDKTLIKATSCGDVKTVETLLKLGANVNTQNRKKQTPLHLASYRAEHAIAKILLENGANVYAQDSNGRTPLHEACFIEANLEMVQILLKHHANVNKRTRTRKTPLHYACLYSEGPDIVEILLENGASLNAQDEDGSTPLHEAASGFNGTASKLEILKILLRHNAEVNARNREGETPLHDACNFEQLEIVQELLKHNPNVNAIAFREMHGERSPLMFAVMKGNGDIVEELLAHGADIDFSDSLLGNSLNIAIEMGHVEMVKVLLKNGCSTNTKAKMFDENEYFTAFESSLYLGYTDILKMLAFHKT